MLIGCHGSVWTGRFDGAGLRRAVEGTAAAGYDLIEFPVFDPAGWDVALTRRLLADNGIVASGSLGLTDDIDISSEDARVVARGEEHLRAVVDVLHALGATFLVGVIYGSMKKHARAATPLEVRHGQEALGRVSEYAATAGIRLGIEVVNRYETNIVNTASHAMTYLDGVPGGRVGLHLDTYHMNIEESDMWQPVLDGADRLAYVHIGESHRGYLGTGSVDFETFFRALGRTGFDGPVVFESFSSAVVDPALTSTLGIWRNLWEDGADLAAHANRFIRDRIHAVETIALH